MGGHHHPKLPKIPNYQIYCVEDVPQLMKVQKRLAQHGLKDNWLRNEVWKYTEEMNKYTRWKRITSNFSAGIKYGLFAAIITSGLEYSYLSYRKAPSYGEHDHH